MNKQRRDEIRAGDVFSREELVELLDVADRHDSAMRASGETLEQYRECWDRLRSIVDEQIGPQHIMCIDSLLTVLERGLFRLRARSAELDSKVASLTVDCDDWKAEADCLRTKVAELEAEKRKSILDSLTADGQWMEETKKLRDEAEGLKNELAKAREDFESVALAVGVYDYAEGLGYKFGTGDEVVRAIETAMAGEREAQEECDNMAAACRLRQLAYDSMAAKASRLRNRIKQLEHEVREAERDANSGWGLAGSHLVCLKHWRAEAANWKAALEMDWRHVEREAVLRRERASFERILDLQSECNALRAKLARVSAIAEEPATTATMPCDPVYVGKGAE